MYNHEQYQYLDLGNDINLGDKSFTLASLIRLRPDADLAANYTNRGTRQIVAHFNDDFKSASSCLMSCGWLSGNRR